MVRRSIAPSLLAALQDTPVALLHGARQTGKSTLAKWLSLKAHPARYLTLDDAAVLTAARTDPASFVAGLGGAVVLDEVQRAPELFLAIKAAVDAAPQPGRFLLTGSANVLLLPQLADSLAGRMEILTLWPLSQGEITGVKENWIDRIFSERWAAPGNHPEQRAPLIARVLTGGYPAVLQRPAPERRQAWLGSYLTTILQRDVRDLANIEGLTALPQLLTLLAARAGSLLNFAEISRSIAIPQSTLKRYMALLQTIFLVQLVPAWSANLGKRLVKAPKVLLNDTGLRGYLLGLDEHRVEADPMLLGSLLENFVAMELQKQVTWSRIRPALFHFRALTGQEVDLVLENRAGEIVGIEVKASARIGDKDFQGLRTLAELTGRRFRRGVLLYLGTEAAAFGPNLHLLPTSALWSQSPEPSA